jgi:CubicO group peptidase (beta-lactamase class C family)
MRLPSLLLLLAASATAQPSGAPPLPLDPLFAPALGDTRAALLIRDGQVVAKRYAPGYADANRFISWSMAKTVTAVLVGELVADGRLDPDAPAPIAEWRKPGDPRGRITLRHLLTMSSGLNHTEVGEPIEASDTNQVLFVHGAHAMAAAAIAQPLEAEPGTKWEYSSLTSVILAEIVTRTLTPSRDPRVRAQAYRDFAQARLFGPAGIRSAVLDFDGAGTQVGGSIIYMSLEDWGRFGRLLIDGKGPTGEEVIAPAWVDELRRPAATAGHYGAQTWLNRPRAAGRPLMYPGAPASTVSAEGHLGQHVTVVPEAKLVVVRLGNTREDLVENNQKAIGRIIAEQLRGP